jgi:hypothetical protein
MEKVINQVPIPLKRIYSTVLDPNRSVIFVDTDPYGLESRVGLKIINKFEQLFICDLVVFMVKSLGINANEIGILSPYRVQVYHLRLLLNEKLGVEESKKIDVYTIDKFQGKDKSCIIMSFVRSNSDQKVDELVTDMKRINVAMTRAKTKLIIVGSFKTHAEKRDVGKYIRLMEKKNWIVPIDEDLAQDIKKRCTYSTQLSPPRVFHEPIQDKINDTEVQQTEVDDDIIINDTLTSKINTHRSIDIYKGSKLPFYQQPVSITDRLCLPSNPFSNISKSWSKKGK